MHVGFTGTRDGMTDDQRQTLYKLLKRIVDRCKTQPVFHHGDCIGADEQAHSIARELGFHIVVHPPDDDSRRAFCQGDETRPPDWYTNRNQDIVNESSLMFAGPKSKREYLRSGTWSTVRFARRRHKPVTKVWPRGGFQTERNAA